MSILESFNRAVNAGEAPAPERPAVSAEGSPGKGYRIIIGGIPPLRTDGKNAYDKNTEAAIHDALALLLAESGAAAPVYERAYIRITVLIGKDIPGSRIPDADNLSIKGIIDALGMTLIRNDDLTSVKLVIEGRLTNEADSRTEVTVRNYR